MTHAQLLVIVLVLGWTSGVRAEDAAPPPPPEPPAWKYAVGDRLRYEATETRRRTVAGRERLISTETMEWEEVVTAIDDQGRVTLDLTCTRYRRVDSSGTVDSSSTDGSAWTTEHGSDLAVTIRKSLGVFTACQLEATTSGSGGIEGLAGVDEVHADVLEAAETRSDAEESPKSDFARGMARGMIESALEKIASDWAVQRFLPQQVVVFPTTGREPDGSWIVRDHIYELSHKRHAVRYRLRPQTETDSLVTIDLFGKTNTPSKKEAAETERTGRTLKQGRAKGSFTFDPERGRLVELELECSFPGPLVTLATHTTIRALPEPEETR